MGVIISGEASLFCVVILNLVWHKTSGAEGARRAPKALAVLGGSGGMPPQKILKTGTPETPFPAIWAMILSAKIEIDNDLIINLKNITGHQ